MATKVTVNLPSLKLRRKNLNNFGSFLIQAGVKVKAHLIDQWDAGRGGDGKPMKKLSPEYKTFKKGKGRPAIPNLKFTGLMRISLTPKIVSSFTVRVGFQDKLNIDKALGNATIRPNMMKLSDKFTKSIVDFLFKKLTGK